MAAVQIQAKDWKTMLTTMQRLKNARLRQYLEAEEKVLLGQSYTLKDRTLTRANLAEIRKAIEDLIDDGATIDDEEILNNGRTKRVVFQDG